MASTLARLDKFPQSSLAQTTPAIRRGMVLNLLTAKENPQLIGLREQMHRRLSNGYGRLAKSIDNDVTAFGRVLREFVQQEMFLIEKLLEPDPTEIFFTNSAGLLTRPKAMGEVQLDKLGSPQTALQFPLMGYVLNRVKLLQQTQTRMVDLRGDRQDWDAQELLFLDYLLRELDTIRTHIPSGERKNDFQNYLVSRWSHAVDLKQALADEGYIDSRSEDFFLTASSLAQFAKTEVTFMGLVLNR